MDEIGQGQFLSTLPARGATRQGVDTGNFIYAFLSTLPARGATDLAGGQVGRLAEISIHAPREGSDLKSDEHRIADLEISIHAPREGSDACLRGASLLDSRFLSTLPARGATSRSLSTTHSL